MPLAEAKKTGALAFFGEKYAESVRVVSIIGISQELCGGTHLDSTGEIGLFKIVHEGSVASGVRRIEAITGKGAYREVKAREAALAEIASGLGVPLEKAGQELAKRLARIKELEKQLHAARIAGLKATLDETIARAEMINGIKVIVQDYPSADMEFLRQAVDLIKGKVGSADALIAVSTAGAASIYLAVGVTGQKLDAGKVVKEIAPEIGGSGGGRKDFAQAGGNQPQNLSLAIEKLREIIKQVKT
jgi:alanyl-tRNA synthetase